MSGTVDLTIRPALPADAPALALLGAATFTETFGHLYPAADLQAFLQDTHSPAGWRRTLTDPRHGVWLARAGSATPIGFITAGVCKLPIQAREAHAGEIQQLYVLAPHHNRGVGSRLMQLGLDWLQARGHSPLYVGVWSENFAAQRFYGRFGFVKVAEYGFAVGNTIDREYILRREVGSGCG